jgi:hypothetical protein
MTSTQIAQYNAELKNIQQNYSTDALKRQAQQELEKGRLSGSLDDPYYDVFREVAKTGSYSRGASLYQKYLDDKTVAEGIRQANIASRIEGATNPAGVARSSSGGGGGGSGGGSGMGSFIGGTTGVFPGYSQYQNYLNNQGQPMTGQPMTGAPISRLTFGPYEARGRRGAIQSAYRKILAANSATPSAASPTAPSSDMATAATVDDNGFVYGMGTVPGVGGNPATQSSSAMPTFVAPKLKPFENRALKKIGATPESLYARGIQQNPLNYGQYNQSFGQPPIINSPFFGQPSTMDGRFGGQSGLKFNLDPSSPYQQMPQMGAMGSRPMRIA